jgi:hypothetical protein
MQAVASADRRHCAFVSAVAALMLGSRLQGTLYSADDATVDAYIVDACREFNLPEYRVGIWARSVAHLEAVPPLPFSSFAGLTFHEFQLGAIQTLTPAGGALGLFCGAGKTVTGAAAAVHLKTAFHYAPRLWIGCPLNAIPAWERMRPHLEPYFSEIRVFSVDSAHKYAAGLSHSGGVLILDELHLLGGRETRRTKACHLLRAKFDACIGLTGTLVHSGVEATLSYADLCVPGAALFANRWSAGDHFKCLVKKKLGPRTVTALEKPTGEHRVRFLEWLARWCYMLRPTSPEVQACLAIPEQALHEIRLVEPWRDTLHEVAEIANRILKETGELPHAQAVMHELARSGIDEKVDYLLENLDPEEQVAIAAFYRESLDAMEEGLKKAGISYTRVDGDVTGADRAECERKFQSGEVRAFLGQMHAASVSMNLQCADLSFTLDLSWSTIDYEQWLFRTRRQGKGEGRSCNHFDLVSNKFQRAVLNRVQMGMDFSAECSEYQEVKRSLLTSPQSDIQTLYQGNEP